MQVLGFKRGTLNDDALIKSYSGTSYSRRLRKLGRTPAIVYGNNTTPEPIELEHNPLFYALKKGKFHSSILDLEIAGQTHKVLLRDFQMHPYKQLVLHVDFQLIDPKKKIHVKVPLHFIGIESSQAIKSGGAIVIHIFNELEIQCLPGDLPEFIEVDLSNIPIGGSVHAKEITLPAGVNLIAHIELEDPVIVAVKLPNASKETPDTATSVATTATATPATK